MAFADVNGVSMYYEVHGEGTPVVFAHGSGGNHISSVSYTHLRAHET